MRLIDADALEAKLEEQRKLYVEMDMKEAEHLLVHDVLHHVWEAPTIDVAPVRHGRNVYMDVKGYCEFKCSLCGADALIVEGGELDGGLFNYCPNCGAKMDEEE